MRSTRVRTLDRTLVSVPNRGICFDGSGELLVAGRDVFSSHVNVRREHTGSGAAYSGGDPPDPAEDPKVEVGNLPVRFVGAGSYSLDVEVFAYIRTADYDEFLKVQQDLLLRILDTIRAAGTALAIPTQASIFYSEPSENSEAARVQQLARDRRSS